MDSVHSFFSASGKSNLVYVKEDEMRFTCNVDQKVTNFTNTKTKITITTLYSIRIHIKKGAKFDCQQQYTGHNISMATYLGMSVVNFIALNKT